MLIQNFKLLKFISHFIIISVMLLLQLEGNSKDYLISTPLIIHYTEITVCINQYTINRNLICRKNNVLVSLC